MRRFLLCSRAFAATLVLLTCSFVAPTPVTADTTSLGCIYEGGSPTTPPINYPSLFECDANRNVKVAGTITASVAFPYNGTNGQTLKTGSFLGVGALDANGAFSPLQEDASQNLLAKIVTGSTTAVTQATGTNLHAVVDSGTVTANAGTGNFTVVQPTGTNLHAVLDTTSTTAVTQPTAANLNATVVGLGVAGTPAGGVVSMQGVAGGTAVPASCTAANCTTEIADSGGTNKLAVNSNGSINSILYNSSAVGIQTLADGTLRTAQARSGTILTSASATACTNLQASAGGGIEVINSGPATTIFPQLYSDAGATCAAGTLLYGDGSTITIGPGQIIKLDYPVAGIAYKLSGALTSNLAVSGL